MISVAVPPVVWTVANRKLLADRETSEAIRSVNASELQMIYFPAVCSFSGAHYGNRTSQPGACTPVFKWVNNRSVRPGKLRNGRPFGIDSTDSNRAPSVM